MRRGRGRGRSFGWGMALYAFWACGGTLRVPENHSIAEIACTVAAPPSATADSATIVFDAGGTTREHCALSIVAETMRPWPLASSEPWTVQLTLFPAHATARPLSSEKARDAIDAGSTLMATDDLDLVAYAASRADFEVIPLSWDRTYLQLSAARTSALGTAAGPDAVRVDARPAEPQPCDSVLPPADSVTLGPSSKRVVFDAADRTARELAERVVALTGRAEATAVGMQASDLASALQRGADLAYIISLPRSSYCDARAALSERTPWLASGSVVPLIDTRAHAIAPRASRP